MMLSERQGSKTGRKDKKIRNHVGVSKGIHNNERTCCEDFKN
jgi:hypothetical protein